MHMRAPLHLKSDILASLINVRRLSASCLHVHLSYTLSTSHTDSLMTHVALLSVAHQRLKKTLQTAAATSYKLGSSFIHDVDHMWYIPIMLLPGASPSQTGTVFPPLLSHKHLLQYIYCSTFYTHTTCVIFRLNLCSETPLDHETLLMASFT